MFVSDLKPNQAVDSITLEIVEIGEPKEFTNFRGTIRVANAKVKDETGQCSLTLWNDEIGKYSEGQRIRITNGWCKEYRGEIQVSSGKYGKTEILDGTGAETENAAPKAAPPKKKPAKKQAKAKKEEDSEEEEEGTEANEEIFPEVEKDPYVKYEDKYGKEDF